MIKIVGLGPGSPDALTIGAVRALEESKNLYFRTEKHPTVDYLKKGLTSFKTCDNYYEEGNSFDEVYSNIANEMIEEYKKCGELVYAVPGHPLVAERSVLNLINLCNENNIEYKILPAVSFVDAMMDRLQIDPIEGLKIIDAFDIKNQILDKRIGTIITQVYNVLIASEVKLELLEYYNDETEIYYVRAAGIEGEESIRKIPLYELDMQEDIDYLTSVYIPKDINNKKDFYDLINTIEILRGEDGCAWDREQTHESIKNSLIEEAYETVEAIEGDNIDGLIEELGDVLLQVVFHSVIGKEDGYFNISDVIEAITTKMIYRHPHVFGNVVADSSKEVLENWDELKKKEKNYETLTEEIEGIAKTLPALTKAHKVQKKVSKVGFDFEDVNEAVKKIEEEINEVLDVYKSNNMEKIINEVGDLLFACVNVARLLNVDEEEALNKSIKKFVKRFKFVEENLLKQDKNLNDSTLDEMNALWEDSKKYD
ncbi:nucleoside triphosphate pyrophosphohydrolase [Clostridium saudiense]|uniref:nucleoside triphosphate pyrophosphohydrolase n=1 Tax=Clostridium saudiense TaxID=1414720 RepID=UPI00324219AC